MPYGTIKVDTVTFTNAGVDKSVTISGLVQNPIFSGNVTVTGTLSGVTVTGTTANFTSGNFTNISGGTHTITSGVFAAGSAASPSITFTGDLNTGIYSPGADQVSVTTGGTERLRVDTTGQIEVVSLGTAAAPVFSFTTDPNTGIYSPGADQVAISTGGSGRLFIDASGRVGVGTVPTATFHANGGTANTIAILESTDPFCRLQLKDGDAINSVFLSGVGDNLVFETNGNTERLRITSAGNVGIGTTNPSVRFDVVGQGRFDHTAVDAISVLRSGTLVGDIGGTSGGGAFSFRSQTSIPITFNIASAEAARIDSSGRLLVGTSSALAAQGVTSSLQLHGATAGQGSGAQSISYWQNNTTSSALLLNKSRGATPGSYTIVQNGDGLGTIAFGGADGTAIVRAAVIDCQVDGTPGTNDMPGRLVFSTTADGASSPTERMRIDSSGAVRTGNNTLYTGTTGAVTASTGTTVFTFDFFGTVSRRTALVKLSVMHLVATNSIAAQPAAEYIFAVEGYTTGASAATTPTAAFQNVYVAATHFAFADTGNTSFTVTLTNPSASAASAVYYKVEVLGDVGGLTLNSVTTT